MSQSQELAEIDESLRAIVRRAYDLGRSEALKKVVSVLNEDRERADQLALMAPEQSIQLAPEPANQAANERPNPPWWAWRVR